jgi:hypothetical protein
LFHTGNSETGESASSDQKPHKLAEAAGERSGIRKLGFVFLLFFIAGDLIENITDFLCGRITGKCASKIFIFVQGKGVKIVPDPKWGEGAFVFYIGPF